LENQFLPSRYQLKLWIDDKGIFAGEEWHQKIQREIQDCDFGLFLLSPSFLGSDYIGKHEIPHFLGVGKKPAFLVGLCLFDPKTQDPHGLGRYQFYLLKQRFYSTLNDKHQLQFVHGFFGQAHQRLEQLVPDIDAPQPIAITAKEAEECEVSLDHSREFLLPSETRDFQPTRGISTTLAGLVTLDGRTPGHDQARDALEELEAWATSNDAPPFFAILGEYGMARRRHSSNSPVIFC